ncbi:hypothetical protein I0C86_30815 [Plantactinospora sp. S1510]|uniref:VCBS repeat-containing protein n=1 Tax=Plantactinospora alkalitolerans TaxID=2789879 RepID=A0ABS0H4D8_9ACTN|nr:hypothetical protein [Plantactinospora alkalitolerans]MBF9133323.1 hypothetical protein [Plantactinospora alkalitolerans]
MWCRRAIAISVVTMINLGIAAPALAGGRGETLYGDLDGDRRTDLIRLVSAPPDRCAVLVRLGRAGGGYQGSKLYTYPEPGGDDGVFQCPDLGTIVDLGRDGSTELVIGWFAGRPAGVDQDLLVLRDFQPDGGTTGLFQPSYVGVADFNGDGRKDIYEWTDQGEGLATHLNTPAGELIPGPINFCGLLVQPPLLADFTLDRHTEVVLPFYQQCGVADSGVAVLFSDSRTEYLEQDPLGEHVWTSAIEDADADGVPDVRTVDRDSGEVSHYLVRPPARFLEAPTPEPDLAVVTAAVPTSIPVLANDAVTVAASIAVVVPPRYGRVQITPEKTLVYIPPATPPATADTFVYRVIDDGKAADAPVTVELKFPAATSSAAAAAAR